MLGFFVWRYYANLDDVSQEAAWGFSPHAKLAERVLEQRVRAALGGRSRSARRGNALPLAPRERWPELRELRPRLTSARSPCRTRVGTPGCS